jgi:hypothetical protein
MEISFEGAETRSHQNCSQCRMLSSIFLFRSITVFLPLLFSTREDVSYLRLSSYQAGGSREAGPSQAAIPPGPEVEWRFHL